MHAKAPVKVRLVTKKLLDRLADHEDRTIVAVLDAAVAEYAERHPPAPAPKRRYRRAETVAAKPVTVTA